MAARKFLAFFTSFVSNAVGRARTSEASYGRTAELSEFPTWMIQGGETDDISAFHLRNLYREFCEYSETDPVSDALLFRGLRAVGIEKYREGTGERRWVYRVRYPELREVPKTTQAAA